jgi:hypothetical protein
LAPGSKIPEVALEEIRSRIDNQPNVKLIDSRITSLNNYQTIFLAYDISFEELEVRQVQYLIFDGDITWIVIYLPNKDKYEEELSIFEQSIRTFKISH